MKIRCTLDGLLLDAVIEPQTTNLIAFDGDEAFTLEAVEAIYYELVSATHEEILRLEQAHLRLLRRSPDFQAVQG